MSSIDMNPYIIKDEDEIVPLAIFLTIDNIEGPILLSMDPIIDRIDIKSMIEFRGIRIFSSIEPMDLVQSGYLYALYPWSDPKGQLACIYFTSTPTPSTSDEHVVRKQYPVVFLVGCIIDRRFSQVLRWLPEEIINHLEEAASNLLETITSKILKGSTPESTKKVDLDLLKQFEGEFQDQLKKTRMKIKKTILKWLQQFE